MKSVIHASDKIVNMRHEFGEATEARYWAVFVAENGTEYLIALTPKQIEIARERAAREHEDANFVIRQQEADTRSDIRVFAVIVGATFAAFAALGWKLLR